MTAFIEARSPEQIDEFLTLRQKCWELFLQGKTTRQIGAECGRSHVWASITIRELTEDRNQETRQSFRGHVEKLLDSNNLIRREAWEGWRRSQQDKVRQVEKEKVGGKYGSEVESSTTTEGQAGDSNFLRVLIECDKRESGLRGIEKPVQPIFQFMQVNLDLDTLILQIEKEAAKEASSPVDMNILEHLPAEVPQ